MIMQIARLITLKQTDVDFEIHKVGYNFNRNILMKIQDIFIVIQDSEIFRLDYKIIWIL